MTLYMPIYKQIKNPNKNLHCFQQFPLLVESARWHLKVMTVRWAYSLYTYCIIVVVVVVVVLPGWNNFRQRN